MAFSCKVIHGIYGLYRNLPRVSIDGYDLYLLMVSYLIHRPGSVDLQIWMEFSCKVIHGIYGLYRNLPRVSTDGCDLYLLMVCYLNTQTMFSGS